MPHDARAVANQLLQLAEEDGNQLTVMQVLKLVYFCHAWMLALYGRPLIEQPIEAWRYGPVIPDVYLSFKEYRGGPITSRAHVKDYDFDDEESHIIKEVYQKYGFLSGIRLSQLTHASDTPWDQVWGANRQNSIIPNLLTKQYYSRKAQTINGSN